MKVINYADQELVTGNEIAKALLAYASALADADKSDSVTIPTRTSGGVQDATVLIGPASQIVITEAGPSPDEMLDDKLVEDLHTRAARLGPRRPVASGSEEDSGSIDDFPDFA